MYLYHYYDKETGPFRNLSDLSVEKAKSVLETIKSKKPNSQSAQRHDKYVEYRRNCERILRSEFAKKGGQISRIAPHYMVVGHSPWLYSWYENCDYIKMSTVTNYIHIMKFWRLLISTVSRKIGMTAGSMVLKDILKFMCGAMRQLTDIFFSIIFVFSFA